MSLSRFYYREAMWWTHFTVITLILITLQLHYSHKLKFCPYRNIFYVCDMHSTLYVPHIEHIFNHIMLHMLTYTTSILINIFYTSAFTEYIKSAHVASTFCHWNITTHMHWDAITLRSIFYMCDFHIVYATQFGLDIIFL